jgi:transposase
MVGIGVDSHKSTLELGVVDEIGRKIATRRFANDAASFGAVLGWTRRHGCHRVIGIEGSGGLGQALARFLVSAGEDVREVPAIATYAERRTTPSRGKSDHHDALSIARVVARDQDLPRVRRDDITDALKLLSDHRDQLVRARTQMINRTHADFVTCHPGYERRVPKLTSKRQRRSALALLRGDHSVRADLARERIGDIDRFERRIKETEAKIVQTVKASGTNLVALKGIGYVLAAKILGEVGDVTAIRSRAAFAMLNGTAPLEASSGAIKRHRLNRGGNRRLNFALHMMATTLARSDGDTKSYLGRQRAQGKTSKEAMRCLKRQLSNVVYRQLLLDAKEPQIAA